ncbi:ParA-like protein [Limihaloglobus sulfuriphilus]|uniref:ParA-like protein n=1 Tax=Limihaloglobus sulfuriphilus TaxID=1851148 RepID=A0A1Q2MHL7_9BACT|nr:ATP-binding protein [Limihaloglobus sulfuriphilus]AQQ71797.1 ParA-like protein [Limihaloglobus sulfuriphilus]
MKIAIASGKGGTGKTTIATNLAYSISHNGYKTQYLDCDAEEPNGHIFLKPHIDVSEDVTIGVPEVDHTKCTGCGKCGNLCQYSAIVCIKGKVLVFEQLCHSCGGCMAICPENAISEKQRKIGIAESGKSNEIFFTHGKLEIGTIQTTVLIKYVKNKASGNRVSIIDAPPGTSCPVIEAIKGCDFVLLVTEPTPFGLNDLELAVGMVRELKLPFAVAVNRSDIGDDSVVNYCQREDIEIMIKIPNDRKVAESYSRGILMVEAIPDYKQKFLKLYENVKRTVDNPKTAGNLYANET